jgi:membrane protease YdiL (CAAX protease family)
MSASEPHEVPLSESLQETAAPPAVEQLPPSPGPWGLWATLGFVLLIGIVNVLSTLAAVILFVVLKTLSGDQTPLGTYMERLPTDGDFLAASIVLGAMVCTPLTIWLAWLRRGYPVREYLAFRRATWRQMSAWLGIQLAVIVACELLNQAFRIPINTEFMIDAYKSASFLPLLFFGFVVAAPLFEELLFRGFIFQGVCRRLGPAAAVVLPAVVFAASHLQYDKFGIANVAIIGLVLAIARLKTESIYVPMAMHMLQNFAATIGAMVEVG